MTGRMRCHRKVGLCHRIRHRDVPCDTSSILPWYECDAVWSFIIGSQYRPDGSLTAVIIVIFATICAVNKDSHYAKYTQFASPHYCVKRRCFKLLQIHIAALHAIPLSLRLTVCTIQNTVCRPSSASDFLETGKQ